MENILNDFDQLLGTTWSGNEDCEISQECGKTETGFNNLSNEELLELRSNLEVELSDLDREMRFVEHYDEDPIECNGRRLYDVEMDRDFTLFKINKVKEELTKRNLKWEGDQTVKTEE